MLVTGRMGEHCEIGQGGRRGCFPSHWSGVYPQSQQSPTPDNCHHSRDNDAVSRKKADWCYSDQEKFLLVLGGGGGGRRGEVSYRAFKPLFSFIQRHPSLILVTFTDKPLYMADSRDTSPRSIVSYHFPEIWVNCEISAIAQKQPLLWCSHHKMHSHISWVNLRFEPFQSQ